MRAHFNNDNTPIATSAICDRCEADAGNRIASYKNAKNDSKDYNGEERKTVNKLLDMRCWFCGRKK